MCRQEVVAAGGNEGDQTARCGAHGPGAAGQFDGVQAIERAYEAYQRGEITFTGCMVHYAIPKVDAGPVIAQTVLEFREGESLEEFALRMHAAEHQLIVRATRQALARLA